MVSDSKAIDLSPCLSNIFPCFLFFLFRQRPKSIVIRRIVLVECVFGMSKRLPRFVFRTRLRHSFVRIEICACHCDRVHELALMFSVYPNLKFIVCPLIPRAFLGLRTLLSPTARHLFMQSEHHKQPHQTSMLLRGELIQTMTVSCC